MDITIEYDRRVTLVTAAEIEAVVIITTDHYGYHHNLDSWCDHAPRWPTLSPTEAIVRAIHALVECANSHKVTQSAVQLTESGDRHGYYLGDSLGAAWSSHDDYKLPHPHSHREK